MEHVIDKMGELELDTYGLAMLAPYPGTPCLKIQSDGTLRFPIQAGSDSTIYFQ